MNKIDELRLIQKGSSVWSIMNQANIILSEDCIVKIAHTCHGIDVVFVKPMQLIFNIPGHIPTIIGKGQDEWSINYNNTESYKVPEPQF
jgi:hypothetical protein